MLDSNIIVFNFKGRKIKLVSLSVLFIFILMWILFAFNTKTTDYGNYELFYQYANNGIRYPGLEIGYYYFTRLCTILGLNFQQFLMLYSFLGLYLIISTVLKLSKHNTAMILLFFVFFPYFHLIAFPRSFFSYSLVLYGIRYLVDNNKRSYIKFIVSVILASLFHLSSLFYLFILFIRIDKKKFNVLIFGSLVLSFVIFSSEHGFLQLISIIIPKLNVYISQGTRADTKIFLVIYYLAKICFCYFLNQYEGEYTESLYKINLLSSSFLNLFNKS